MSNFSISINFETQEQLASFIEKILLDETFEGEIVDAEASEDAVEEVVAEAEAVVEAEDTIV